jgi:hypothetical protein
MTMYTGVSIENNKNINSGIGGANAGGGLRILAGGTFTMEGGLIQKNSAQNGGGVVINPASGTIQTLFTMNGGEIKTNLAESGACFGGGVASMNHTTAVLSGTGTIHHNSIALGDSTKGSGWHALGVGSSTSFTVTKANITNNSDLNSAGSLQYNTGW